MNTATERLDSDGDGMVDSWEALVGLNPVVNDSGGNPDSDAYTNIEEYNAGLNPFVAEPAGSPQARAGLTLSTAVAIADTDGDGMPDWWELANGLSISSNDAAGDADGDTRSNLDEYNAGTDPTVDDWLGPTVVASTTFFIDSDGLGFDLTLDTDGDGMPDWWEDLYGLNSATNDASGDLDQDGRTNLYEYEAGFFPHIDDTSGEDLLASLLFHIDTAFAPLDTDGDGMTDWWELLNGLNPNTNDASLNPDGDDLTNIEEYNGGRNPQQADSRPSLPSESIAFTINSGGYHGGFYDDSDNDGMPDWWEALHSLNVGADDSLGNPDFDARTNIEEYAAGSDPRVFDTELPENLASLSFIVDTGGYLIDSDGDGLPNWWERRYFGGLTNGVWSADTDGDGLTDWGEFLANTDPWNQRDMFRVHVRTIPVGYEISWATVIGRSYSFHRFATPNAATSTVEQIAGTGVVVTRTNEVSQSAFVKVGIDMSE